MQNSLPFDRSALENYLATVFNAPVEITEIRKLIHDKKEDKIKDFGYGSPLFVEIQSGGISDRLVIHTVRQDKFGHERRSDRAGNILLGYDTFNKLSRHVPCLGAGAFTGEGEIVSLANTTEFFLITRYTPGRLFAQDLKKLLDGAELIPEDKSRVLALADYLVQIHNQKYNSPMLYHRYIRDLFGHGEGIFGLTDSYPSHFSIAPPARLRAIERKLINWGWALKDRAYRLSQVHGDFHPWNVLFQKDGMFFVLDRSRGEWGEPADDVSAMSINFIFFSLQRFGALQGTFKVLFEIFWEYYLQNTQDVELVRVIQPFFAWRALVLAHPTWHPHISPETRQLLFNFIVNVLAEKWFDPQKINTYLRSK